MTRPGSRIRNPDPAGASALFQYMLVPCHVRGHFRVIEDLDAAAYSDVAPPMGFGWWALIVSSVRSSRYLSLPSKTTKCGTTEVATFFWGNTCSACYGAIESSCVAASLDEV